MIAIIKRCLWKCLEAYLGATWYEVLPDILHSMRTLPSMATGVHPYLVSSKQYPKVPLSLTLHRQVFGAPWMEKLLGSGNPLDG